MLINIIQPISTPKMTRCRLLYEVHGYEIFQLGLFNSDPHAGNAWISVVDVPQNPGIPGVPMVFPMISSRLISTDYIWLYINIYISKDIQTLGMGDWVRIRWLLGDPMSCWAVGPLNHGDGAVECEEHLLGNQVFMMPDGKLGLIDYGACMRRRGPSNDATKWWGCDAMGCGWYLRLPSHTYQYIPIHNIKERLPCMSKGKVSLVTDTFWISW